MWGAISFVVLLLAAPVVAAEAVGIVVENASSKVNGDVTNIATLLASPGSDGISLVEAIAAANGTAGPKTIGFAPALKGASIAFGSDAIHDFGFFSLRSGDLTIDGDIDGDGTPDVTLEATGSLPTTLHIRSSNIVIRNLVFHEFAGYGINFACTDTPCAEHTIANVRIERNVFDSSRGWGVAIGVWGLLDPRDLTVAASLSNMEFSDITIDHNTIRAPLEPGTDGISVRACSDGQFNSRYSGIYVTNNHITAGTAIDGGASDEAWPPNYSDHCAIHTFVIDGNVIDGSTIGIYFDASNLGNQDNVVENFRITNNHISGARLAMTLGGANLPDPTRDTRFNRMSDLLISGNVIDDSQGGIVLTAGNWPTFDNPPTVVDDNIVDGVRIVGNQIRGFTGSGINIWGAFAGTGAPGHGSSHNRMSSVTIEDNVFEAGTGGFPGFPVALSVVGGESASGNPAAANEVGGVRIVGNTFRDANVAILLVGGTGTGATGNVVGIASMAENIFERNRNDVRILDDDKGGTGNRVVFARRRAVHH